MAGPGLGLGFLRRALLSLARPEQCPGIGASTTVFLYFIEKTTIQTKIIFPSELRVVFIRSILVTRYLKLDLMFIGFDEYFLYIQNYSVCTLG